MNADEIIVTSVGVDRGVGVTQEHCLDRVSTLKDTRMELQVLIVRTSHWMVDTNSMSYGSFRRYYKYHQLRSS